MLSSAPSGQSDQTEIAPQFPAQLHLLMQIDFSSLLLRRLVRRFFARHHVVADHLGNAAE